MLFRFRILFILIFFLFNTSSFSQITPQTKVGLCLSGGGAKGLAHIGLLKLIDSLNIRIDYITGTSMGAVIGGLYAYGYTGKQIDSIAKSIDWDKILTRYEPFKTISIDEKDEYEKYIGEIPIYNFKFVLSGLIEGNAAVNYLADLTNHANFSDLKIPFKCIAVDLVNVQPVILSSGNFAESVFASMSIPTVFRPIKIDGKILSDGGLVINFPINQLKEMGAEFIIGNYTGGRLFNEDELVSIDKLLLQTSSFNGIRESSSLFKECGIFNNLSEHMLRYGPKDFKKTLSIMYTGDTLARKLIPELTQLSFAQNNPSGYKQPLKKSYDEKKLYQIKKVQIDTIDSDRILQFVKHQIHIKENDCVTTKKMQEANTKLLGTRLFSKAYYILEVDSIEKTYILKYKLKQDYKFALKGSVYYERLRNTTEAGAIINYTSRSILGANSRFLFTINLSDNFMFYTHYKKFYGNNGRFSLHIKLIKEGFRSSNYINWQNNDYSGLRHLNGAYDSILDYSGRYSLTNYTFNMGVACNLSLNRIITYKGFYSNRRILKPRSNFPDAFEDQKYITNFKEKIVTRGLHTYHALNTLDSRYFSKKGWDIHFEHQFSIKGKYKIFYTHQKFASYSHIDTLDWINFKPHFKLYYRIGKYSKINKHITLITELQSGWSKANLFGNLIIDTITANIDSFYYINDSPLSATGFHIGGYTQYKGMINNIALPEFTTAKYSTSQFLILNISTQLELFKNFYITPTYKFIGKDNLTKLLFDWLVTGKKLATQYHIFSLGIGYKSPIGPLTINFSIPYDEKLRIDILDIKRLRSNLSFGFRF